MNILKAIWAFIEEYFATKDAVITPPEAPQAPVAVATPEPAPVVISAPNLATVRNFCLAIESREGYIAPCPTYPTGTSSWRHKNPGNCKDLNGNFLTFASKDEGFAYLENYVKRVMANEHSAYPHNPTIAQYFAVYAPTNDANDPVSYSEEVAGKCGVTVDFLVKNLV